MKTIELTEEQVKELKELVKNEFGIVDRVFDTLFTEGKYELSETYATRARILGEIYNELNNNTQSR